MAIEEIPVGKFGYIQRKTLDWFSAHLNVAALAGAALVGLLFVGGKMWFRGDAEVDFMAAQIAYHKWNKGQEALTKLEKLIGRHPELHAKYDGAIAQRLIGSSEKGLADFYAVSALKRTVDFSPYYSAFAQGSLLIADGKLAEALTAAKELKIGMENDELFWEKRSQVVCHGSLLYTYNLLRIAILEKAAGSPQGELAAWKEFKRQEREKPKTYDPEAYALVQQNFRKQAISLLDFIQYREEFISSSSAKSH